MTYYCTADLRGSDVIEAEAFKRARQAIHTFCNLVESDLGYDIARKVEVNLYQRLDEFGEDCKLTPEKWSAEEVSKIQQLDLDRGPALALVLDYERRLEQKRQPEGLTRARLAVNRVRLSALDLKYTGERYGLRYGDSKSEWEADLVHARLDWQIVYPHLQRLEALRAEVMVRREGPMVERQQGVRDSQTVSGDQSKAEQRGQSVQPRAGRSIERSDRQWDRQ